MDASLRIVRGALLRVHILLFILGFIFEHMFL